MNTLWGLDLGGTKIEGIVLDKSNGNIISRLRVPTEGHLGYDHVLGQIHKLIGLLEQESGQKATAIGMGTPGTLDPHMQQMKNCNSTSLNGKNLKADLESLTGKAFKLSNDANCFAVAETKMGIVPEIMPKAEVVFGIIMGTGVGGGIVVNGQVLNGRHGIAGEWGHNFLDTSGGPCYCGQIGCVETVLSGPGMERYYHSISGVKKTMKEISASFNAQNDSYAVKTYERMYHFFGKAVGVVINILDPDVIVIGGGVGNIDEIYTFGVEALKKHVNNPRLDTIITKPKLGDSAGVFGAAYL